MTNIVDKLYDQLLDDSEGGLLVDLFTARELAEMLLRQCDGQTLESLCREVQRRKRRRVA